MKKQLDNIIISAGGTGGHIYPAISVASQIIRNNPSCRILFVGPGKKIENDIFSRYGYSHKSIKCKGLKRGSLTGIFASLFYLFIGFMQSLLILIKFRPQAVLSFGGYFSAPVVFASLLLNIPVVIHEQNVLPGLATKISMRFASKIAVSFDETLKFITNKDNVFVTGNPVRAGIAELQKNKPIQNSHSDAVKKNILIVGGSLGASSINRAVVEMLPCLDTDNLSITHICGERDFNWVKGTVDKMDLRCGYKLYSYLDDMSKVLSFCDIIVSRAGATILSEISALGIPAILIPYPYSADGHQLVNADVFEKIGAAIILRDDLLTAESLSKAIKKIINDKNIAFEMARNSAKLFKSDADIKILELINETI